MPRHRQRSHHRPRMAFPSFSSSAPAAMAMAVAAVAVFTILGALMPTAAPGQPPPPPATVRTGLPAPVESGQLAVDGGRIWYEIFGEHGPTLVLIHDGLAHGEIWDDQVAALAGDYRLVRYDRRGYGHSEKPETPYSNVDDLEALLAHVAGDAPGEPVVLIGSSSGGGLCLDYTLAHPERVEALVLAGAVVSGMGYSSFFNKRGYENYAEDPAAMAAKWVADRYAIAPGNDTARKRLAELLEAFPNNLDLSKHYLMRRPKSPALPRLGEIEVPVLLITASEDHPDVHAHAGAIETGIVGARRIVLEGCGHLPYLERPQEFANTVREFLSMISLPAGIPNHRNSFRRGFCRTPNSDLYYEIMGEGEPLVLLHGGMIDHRMWDDQFALLAERYLVVRYDIGDHGLSHGRVPGRLEHEDLAALMDCLGIQKAHLMGLSLGGRIALDFAITHPERTGKLVLVSSGMSGYEFKSPEFKSAYAELAGAWRAGDWDGAVEKFMQAWTVGPRRTFDEVDPDVIARVRRMGANCIRLQFSGGEGAGADPPAIRRLAEVKAPTLAILGDEDMPGIGEILAMVEQQVAGARKVTIEGTAHMLNMERPEAFNRIVLEFLGK
jgi:3-oxoadipate enol-lactonase